MSPARQPSPLDRLTAAVQTLIGRSETSDRKIDAVADDLSRLKARVDEGVKVSGETAAKLEVIDRQAQDRAAVQERNHREIALELFDTKKRLSVVEAGVQQMPTDLRATAEAAAHVGVAAASQEVKRVGPRWGVWAAIGALSGSGVGLGYLLDHVPKWIHAAWVGATAAGGDLIK